MELLFHESVDCEMNQSQCVYSSEGNNIVYSENYDDVLVFNKKLIASNNTIELKKVLKQKLVRNSIY